MRTLLVLLAALFFTSGPAFAGYRGSYPVWINVNSDGSGYFMGSLGDTRATTDAVSHIGCDVYASWGSVAGTCFARDNAGHDVSCRFNGAAYAQAAAAVNSSTWLQVSFDKSGTCTFISAQNGSFVGPIAP